MQCSLELSDRPCAIHSPAVCECLVMFATARPPLHSLHCTFVLQHPRPAHPRLRHLVLLVLLATSLYRLVHQHARLRWWRQRLIRATHTKPPKVTPHTTHHPTHSLPPTPLTPHCLRPLLCHRRGAYWIILCTLLGVPALLHFHGVATTEKVKMRRRLGSIPVYGNKKKKDKQQSEGKE